MGALMCQRPRLDSKCSRINLGLNWNLGLALLVQLTALMANPPRHMFICQRFLKSRLALRSVGFTFVSRGAGHSLAKLAPTMLMTLQLRPRPPGLHEDADAFLCPASGPAEAAVDTLDGRADVEIEIEADGVAAVVDCSSVVEAPVADGTCLCAIVPSFKQQQIVMMRLLLLLRLLSCPGFHLRPPRLQLALRQLGNEHWLCFIRLRLLDLQRVTAQRFFFIILRVARSGDAIEQVVRQQVQLRVESRRQVQRGFLLRFFTAWNTLNVLNSGSSFGESPGDACTCNLISYSPRLFEIHISRKLLSTGSSLQQQSRLSNGLIAEHHKQLLLLLTFAHADVALFLQQPLSSLQQHSWVELHFSTQDAQEDMQQQHQALLQSSSQQRAMERLLREAQRSGASSISQSGNASPIYGDCRSPPALAEEATTNTSSKATAEFMQNNTDWLWDWSGHSFAGTGRSKRGGGYRGGSKSAASSTGSLSLRKSGLMRRQTASSVATSPYAADASEATWQNWAYYCWVSMNNYYPQPVVSAITHAVCFIFGAASLAGWDTMKLCCLFLTALGFLACLKVSSALFLEFFINEELPVNSEFGNVKTAYFDSQGIDTGTAKFSLFQATQKYRELFAINSTSGVLRVNQRVDREQLCDKIPLCSIKFNVLHTTHEVAIKVNILDINDCTPKFPSEPVVVVEIRENNQEGYAVPIAAAHDPDLGRNAACSLKHPKRLDREQQDSYNMTLLASATTAARLAPAPSRLRHVNSLVLTLAAADTKTRAPMAR
uniref:Cadherin_2 domain-containing protein n=1 Tax=Macrostomum lignano TaxID=282301 RepID=A0A1I8IQ49_9PLAT